MAASTSLYFTCSIVNGEPMYGFRHLTQKQEDALSYQEYCEYKHQLAWWTAADGPPYEQLCGLALAKLEQEDN